MSMSQGNDHASDAEKTNTRAARATAIWDDQGEREGDGIEELGAVTGNLQC
jgi:hypothetical protein